MHVTIREAEVADAAGIALVQVASWKSTYSGIVPDAFLASMDVQVRTEGWKQQLAVENVSIFIAEDYSGIFGFVSGGRLRERLGDYDAELYAIYLLPAKQRQGVGRRLARELARALNAVSLKGLVVWVLEQNPAVGFYQRLGATQVARKLITIGDAELPEIALAWPTLDGLISNSP